MQILLHSLNIKRLVVRLVKIIGVKAILNIIFVNNRETISALDGQ